MVFFILIIVSIVLIHNHGSNNLPNGPYVHDSIYDRAKNAKTADEYCKLTRPIDEYNGMAKNNNWK